MLKSTKKMLAVAVALMVSSGTLHAVTITFNNTVYQQLTSLSVAPDGNVTATATLGEGGGVTSYTVSTKTMVGGVISQTSAFNPTSASVLSGGTKQFTVSLEGNSVSSVGGCGGSFDAATNTFTTGQVTQDCVVEATFPAPVVTADSGACGPVPANVKVVNAGALGEAFAQQLYSPTDKNEIHAFKLTVPANAAGDLWATRAHADALGKLLTVSACPGDYKAVVNDGARGCSVVSAESSNLRLTTDPNADKRTKCILQPGQTYYVNAASRKSLTDDTYTCSSTTTCRFYSGKSGYAY